MVHPRSLEGKGKEPTIHKPAVDPRGFIKLLNIWSQRFIKLPGFSYWISLIIVNIFNPIHRIFDSQIIFHTPKNNFYAFAADDLVLFG